MKHSSKTSPPGFNVWQGYLYPGLNGNIHCKFIPTDISSWPRALSIRCKSKHKTDQQPDFSCKHVISPIRLSAQLDRQPDRAKRIHSINDKEL